jgi:hypothetical protein
MDIHTFYHLSPQEFEVIYRHWAERSDTDNRKNWEQVRLICYHAIRPYMKRSISLTKFMPLAWDKKSKSLRSRKKDPKRFEMLKKKYGEKI